MCSMQNRGLPGLPPCHTEHSDTTVLMSAAAHLARPGARPRRSSGSDSAPPVSTRNSSASMKPIHSCRPPKRSRQMS